MSSSQARAFQRNITKAYLFKFAIMFHFFAGVIIPFFTIWGGITFARVMILQAVFTFSTFLLEVPTGAVADRFGRKISLILASVATAIATLVYSSYPNFWIFVLGEFLWAIGFALMSGADQALLYDSLRELGRESESKKILGRWESLGIIAIMIAAPIGSLIAKYLGLRYAMLLMSIPMMLSGIVALTFKEPTIGRPERSVKYLQTIREGFIHLKDHKILRYLTFDYISISALSFFVVWVYQVVLEKLDVSIEWFGFVCSILTFSQIIVLNNFTRLENFLRGKRRYIFLTALLIGISFIIMAISRNIIISVIAMALISAFGISRKTLFQNYMNKYIDSHNRATVLSVVSMLYSLSSAILNVIWGYLVDWNLTITLIIIGSLAIILALFSKIKEEHLID